MRTQYCEKRLLRVNVPISSGTLGDGAISHPLRVGVRVATYRHLKRANDYVRVASRRASCDSDRTLSISTMSAASVSTKHHDELQYLNLIKNVLDTGESRPDRTGTGTISVFAPPSLRFSLA